MKVLLSLDIVSVLLLNIDGPGPSIIVPVIELSLVATKTPIHGKSVLYLVAESAHPTIRNTALVSIRFPRAEDVSVFSEVALASAVNFTVALDNASNIPFTPKMLTPLLILPGTKSESPWMVCVPVRYLPAAMVLFDVPGVIVCAPWVGIVPVSTFPFASISCLPLRRSAAVPGFVSVGSGFPMICG